MTPGEMGEVVDQAKAEIVRLRAETEGLRAALERFVASYQKDAQPIPDSDLDDEQPRTVRVTLGDCRKAARALR